VAAGNKSICYAVKMHKNPETGIYLNLCRYNVILHYPKMMANTTQRGTTPSQRLAGILLLHQREWVWHTLLWHFYTNFCTFCGQRHRQSPKARKPESCAAPFILVK